MSPKKTVLAINLFVSLFVIIYLYATGGPIPGGDFPEEGIYLFHEKFAGSLFSALQIFAISLAALGNAFLCFSRQEGHQCSFWLASSLGFAFFAIDEYFLIHENLDRWIIYALNLPHNHLTDKIDDLIVVSYALIALWVLKKSWPWLRQYPAFIRNVTTGFLFLFAMAIFDLGSIKFTPVKELEEDICKIFAEAFFLLAYLSCLKKPPQSPAK